MLTSDRLACTTPAVLLFLVAGALCSAAPAHAQPSSSVRCGPSADCPVLTLDAFLDQVLQANPEARALRLEDDRAAAQLLDARGAFDPHLVSGYEYKTQADADKLNVLRSGVTMPFDVPMSPNLMLDYRRGLGSSIDPSVATSSVGEARFGVSVSPLSGFSTDKQRAALRKARLEPRRADAVQARKRNRLLLNATRAFWTWVEARRTLQINRDLLELATRRRDFVVRRARAGEAAAIDSVEAQLAVANREGKVASAVRKAEQAGVKLAVFLWNEDGTPRPLAHAPPALPAQMAAAVDTAQAAVDTALRRRPELQEVAVKQRKTRIEQRLARQQLRPDVKLEAQVVSYDQSPLNVSDVKVGFKIDQPLFFRGSRSEAERAQIETQELRFKQTLTERKVEADVEAARVALRQARRRMEAAERRVQLAEQLQQAEQRRFELGESTLFLVNQREQAFAEAREERVAARIEMLKARATFRWATGTIADGHTSARR